MGIKPLHIDNRGTGSFFHLAAQVNQACLAECWAEGCFHALKFPILAKGNLLSLHKDFHGCEINKLSLDSKCNPWSEHRMVLVISAEQTKRVCVLLQLDGFMGFMYPLEQQWADDGSSSKIKIFTHFFLFNLNWIFFCWIESFNGSGDNIQSTERLPRSSPVPTLMWRHCLLAAKSCICSQWVNHSWVIGICI